MCLLRDNWIKNILILRELGQVKNILGHFGKEMIFCSRNLLMCTPTLTGQKKKGHISSTNEENIFHKIQPLFIYNYNSSPQQTRNRREYP